MNWTPKTMGERGGVASRRTLSTMQSYNMLKNRADRRKAERVAQKNVCPNCPLRKECCLKLKDCEFVKGWINAENK